MSKPWQYNEPAPATPHPPVPQRDLVLRHRGQRNRAVLQRGADTAAVVYGRVAGGVAAEASVGVTVTEVGAWSYMVAATVVSST